MFRGWDLKLGRNGVGLFCGWARLSGEIVAIFGVYSRPKVETSLGHEHAQPKQA